MGLSPGSGLRLIRSGEWGGKALKLERDEGLRGLSGLTGLTGLIGLTGSCAKRAVRYSRVSCRFDGSRFKVGLRDFTELFRAGMMRESIGNTCFGEAGGELRKRPSTKHSAEVAGVCCGTAVKACENLTGNGGGSRTSRASVDEMAVENEACLGGDESK